MVPTWNVTSFYKFVPLQNLDSVKQELKVWMSDHATWGLIVVATEGINGTVASQQSPTDFKGLIEQLVGEVRFKDSECDERPFERISVDIREEIVGMKAPGTVPTSQHDHHLSPTEWHEQLQKNPILIDTRNRYETVAGKFKGAIDPEIDHFSEWPGYLDRAELPKDEPILIYCTGGIRCEKAILAMRERGYDNVFQLRDGILGYLAEYPDAQYEGECFVFDYRVTVGQDLRPTGNYGICPGCGLTSSQPRQCTHCEKEFFACDECHWTVCGKKCRSEVEAGNRKHRLRLP